MKKHSQKIAIRPVMLNLFYGFIALLVIWVILKLFSFSSTDLGNDKVYKAEIRNNYKIYSFPIPKKLSFAGENVPIENIDVRESLDKELLKVPMWHSELLLYIKRANRFFPVIEKILKENNLHDDFKYLAITESGLETVTSPAGARGYWQFMKGTGKEYGLEINAYVDERYNLEKSTLAACKLLKKTYKRYNSWALVAAAYNMGPSKLNRQIKKQKISNYYDLAFNRETSRYVYRILAVKLVMTNPIDYGFRFRGVELYYPYKTKTIEVDSSINNLADFAITHNTNYKILKILNPWLISNKLPNKSKKKYFIKILEKNGRVFKFEPDKVLFFTPKDTSKNINKQIK